MMVTSKPAHAAGQSHPDISTDQDAAHRDCVGDAVTRRRPDRHRDAASSLHNLAFSLLFLASSRDPLAPFASRQCPADPAHLGFDHGALPLPLLNSTSMISARLSYPCR